MDVVMIRIDKYLADMGFGTRSEIKKAIRQGLVAIDSNVVRKPEEKLDPERQKVSFAGKSVTYAALEYYMLHKPAGVVSATEDKKERTVMDLLPKERRKDLFPVGRLDKDTEGLLLITNDGSMAHALLSPKKHVDKTYFARVRGWVTEEDRIAFRKGIDIGDEKQTLPAELTILQAGEESEIRLTIREGRFHQVKRMFEAVGKEVVYLKRLSMGPLTLDPSLSAGNSRQLTEEEIQALQRQCHFISSVYMTDSRTGEDKKGEK
ncbi:MAG TPA: 16S rRNA pseudouridine(516) synthase [Lachnospiraceae bacterium]|nr:16S rRNA pseudouridine(516) synthase [Lachnospiraceae bacterium]